ncbi:hypothetical protein LTR06_011195 [Exophiala xenobiotica]|nr:hypothetical protein LTR06_011195 [Exophiala xenobiotica]
MSKDHQNKRSDRRIEANSQDSRADWTTLAKEVVVAVDFGTNNSIVAVSTGAKQLPSRGPFGALQHDNNNEPIRYGNQVSPGDRGVLQWFKHALLADDKSGVRTEAVKQISDRGLTEEEVVIILDETL